MNNCLSIYQTSEQSGTKKEFYFVKTHLERCVITRAGVHFILQTSGLFYLVDLWVIKILKKDYDPLRA